MNLMVVFKLKLICTLAFLHVSGNFISSIDKKACFVFNENLGIIKQRIKSKEPFDVSKVNNAIDFLEEVTRIRSQSNGNYFGRFNPTKTDYTNWDKWFKKNKTKLYWDENEKKVKVKNPNSANG